MGESVLNLPATKWQIHSFVEQTTPDSSSYYVYILKCETPPDETIRKRVKQLYPPKTKQEVREWFEENNPLWPDEFSEEKRERTLERESGYDPPGWAHIATDAEENYYVGATTDVAERITDHLNGSSAGGAHFTEVLPPIKLCDVEGYETEEEAYEAETQRSLEITDLPDIQAYSF